MGETSPPSDSDRLQDQIERIRANAEMLIESLNPLVDFEFGYDEPSLDYLDRYLDGQYERGKASGSGPPDITAVVGSYVGEAIVAIHGGEWVQAEGIGLAVDSDGLKASPFNKVAKLLANGLVGGDSVASFVRVIPAIKARSDESG